ncbi:S1/P1 nuclease [Sulfidibacter corallicola]|uniref:S1/P1 nuclease n=1 Tax=Sulfidibacter corallicola TaxID=2818388 RepID=A0A8A4TLP3_SULCO|nr:S1/P1 nuclease [Sulfidibacter corallicola]QTD50876.1 S1/P1 nuclease [Sulfidibacter corallicola]
MKRTLFSLFAVSLLVLPQPVLAWGYEGHRIVGHIAAAHLTPKTREAIRELLGDTSMAELCTWADEIRSDPVWSPRENGKSLSNDADWRDRLNHRFWHYLTVPDKQALKRLERTDHPLKEGYLYPKMLDCERVLLSPDASREEKINALRFFAHLVGDVHQPLHVGNGTDRGGNDVRVTWRDSDGSLHWIWDSAIIEREELPAETYAARLNARITTKQVRRWSRADYSVWVRESFKMRPRAYKLPDAGENNLVPIDESYADRNKPAIEKRLQQAGVRLAYRLNQIFDKTE